MGRSDVVDGLRGYFLVFMMVNHIVLAGGVLLAKINHAELGYVQDAQGFVLLSGLVAGLYYTGVATRRSHAEASARLWNRAWTLYLYTMLVIALITATVLVIPGAADRMTDFMGNLTQPRAWTLLAAALLIHSPTFSDLLVQYVIYLAATPLLLRLILAGYAREVAFGSVALWASVQIGLHVPFVALLDGGLGALEPGLEMRTPFNVLAWQILYVTGLLAGCAVRMRRFDKDFWFPVERPPALVPALAVVAGCAVWRLSFAADLVPPAVAERFLRFEDRTEFSLLYLVNFAALAYAVAWLLIAGPRSSSPAAVAAGNLLHRLFSLSFLRLLGRHSLHVYLFHVLVTYAIILLDQFHGPFGQGTKSLILIAAVASLALPALVREHRGALRVPQNRSS